MTILTISLMFGFKNPQNLPDHVLRVCYLPVLDPQRPDACEGCCDAPGCSDPASTQCHLGRCHGCVGMLRLAQ